MTKLDPNLSGSFLALREREKRNRPRRGAWVRTKPPDGQPRGEEADRGRGAWTPRDPSPE